MAAILLLTTWSSVPADESKTETPQLEVLSPAGAGKDVKVYNDDLRLFFARRAGDTRARLLRGVRFLLYRAEGSPDRPSDRMAESEDPPRWGNPPSSFVLPMTKRQLPVGAYRLRATKPGFKKGEIRVVQCEFGYIDLERIHEKSRYVASLSFRLADATEKRTSIDLAVRIESRDGARIDGATHRIRPTPKRRCCYESVQPLRLSSSAKKPKKDAPAVPGRTLRLIPGCRLVVFLDRTKFVWPVPLPPGGKRTSCSDPDLDRGGRGR